MKPITGQSSVYVLYGCNGNLRVHELEWGLSAAEARRRATALRRRWADAAGLGYRTYLSRHGGVQEGAVFSGRSGWHNCTLDARHRPAPTSVS